MDSLFFCILMMIALEDLKSFTIPDDYVLMLIIYGALVHPERHVQALVVLGLSNIMYLLFQASFGYGDVKLFFGLSFFQAEPLKLLLIACVTAIICYPLQKGISEYSEIPFGPYLVWASILSGWPILRL